MGYLEERLEHGISKVQKTINEYQDALGLKMDILDDGHIQFTFVCIHPREPQAKYVVEVRRQGTDKLIGKISRPPQLGKTAWHCARSSLD